MHGIGYVWIPELGGRRRRVRDAPPSAWQVEAFAAYADHLRSAEFRAGFDRVREMTAARPTAIMCAQASPYRCHRRLISHGRSCTVSKWRTFSARNGASVTG